MPVGSTSVVSVAFLPEQLNGIGGQVCIVVDVLRASSTMVMLFGRGAAGIWAVPRIAQARRYAGARRGRLFLCGEDADGRRPHDFDANPSPSALMAHDLTGRDVLLSTTNGTSAMFAARAAGAACVLVGSLLNGNACVREAAAEARRRARGVVIVCAGRNDNRAVALDDAYCAGYLVAQFSGLPGPERSFEFHDSAVVARRLCESFACAEEALQQSSSGRVLQAIGDAADITFCAQLSTSEIIPRLDGGPWSVALLDEDRAPWELPEP